MSAVWKYETPHQLVFEGTTGEAQAIYFLECRWQAATWNSTCSVVSFDAQGTERWRQPDAFASVAPLTRKQLMVIGPRLVVSVPGANPTIRVFDTATGQALPAEKMQLENVRIIRLHEHSIALNNNRGLFSMDLATGQFDRTHFDNDDEYLELQMVSGGDGTLFGSSSFGGDLPWGSPMRGYHVFATSRETAGWETSVPLREESAPLALFEDKLLLSTPEIRDARTGVLRVRLDGNTPLLEAVMPSAGMAIGLTTRMLTSCEEVLLQRFDTESGELDWACQTSPLNSGRALLPSGQLIATDDGGVILTGESDRVAKRSVLIVLDADGHPRLQYSLGADLRTDEPFQRVEPALIGHRYITASASNPRSGSVLMAFDLPGVRAASEGWVTPRGRFTRDGTPLPPSK